MTFSPASSGKPRKVLADWNTRSFSGWSWTTKLILELFSKEKASTLNVMVVLVALLNLQKLSFICWDCSFAHRWWVTLIPFKRRGTSIYEETCLALDQIPKEFGLELIILGYWHIWTQRNRKIFRNERSTVQNWRRNLSSNLSLLQHRIKPKFRDGLVQWIDNNLD